MLVQKTAPHHGNTLAHGAFRARETVHVCAGRCHYPDGTLVTQRAERLQQLLIPLRTMGYDLLVHVGLERFLHHRQREEIQRALLAEHGLSISTGTISDLVRLFGEYLKNLHEDRAGDLRQALESDGGYPLHIDATGENGRGTLFVAYAGWRRWVLGAWKIPTERADAILPKLHETVDLFGPPCAIVRDLGKAMINATKGLVVKLKRSIPILSCHEHFLADIGQDLLKDSHSKLRNLFRHHKVRGNLRSLAREIGRKIEGELPQVREAVQAWLEQSGGEHALPEGNQVGLGAVRSLSQWVLDFPADSTGADFPFDRPYLDLYDRCLRGCRAVDAFFRKPPDDKETLRALQKLARILDPVRSEASFTHEATTLQRRAELLDELRTALRLHLPKDDVKDDTPAVSERALLDVKAAVENLAVSLRKRRPKRGPAQDTRKAIDLILKHLDRHGNTLWGHAIALPEETGGGVRLVERTNNLLELFYRMFKQGERRRSGRKVLSDDLEKFRAEGVFAQNLSHPDYVEILCGSLEELPQAFADLDAKSRRRSVAAKCSPGTPSRPDSSETSGASLPKEDRQIVRSKAMRQRVHRAARSRAPRVTTKAGRAHEQLSSALA